jgi:glycosyltransferase involved in cell wall biosynthesis
VIKVIHIIPSLRKGGAERLALDIVRNFQSKNSIEIKLVIFRKEIEFAVDDIFDCIKIIPSSVSLSLKRKSVSQIEELKFFLEEFKPDIIHCHLFEAEWVRSFCYFPKTKWFSHLHDNMVQLRNFSFKSMLYKQAITNYYEKTVLFKNYEKNGGTHFIAISKHTESYIKSVQSKYPVTLLHNAINVKRFQRRLSSVEGNHSQQSSSPVENQPLVPLAIGTSLNLINIGSFNENKNQSFLLDIIIELNKLNQRVNCIFLGDGKLKKEVEEKSKKLKIYDQCKFQGNVENVEEFLWKSEIYVHTALSEALGLTLLEAMAAGLPVVTLDGGGNKDIIENGKNGFILNEQDPKLFAEKILDIRYNEEMKKYNEQFVQKFDIDYYTNKLIELYQKR